jgi:putative FmdB family regulatory protein
VPIYEYQAIDQSCACDHCRNPFEVLHGMHEAPLDRCPRCGAQVQRVISWCRAAVAEGSQEEARVDKSIREYEQAGMWSHAAELADTHSAKSGDVGLKTRALDNYRKAGYDVDSMIGGSKSRHSYSGAH